MTDELFRHPDIPLSYRLVQYLIRSFIPDIPFSPWTKTLTLNYTTRSTRSTQKWETINLGLPGSYYGHHQSSGGNLRRLGPPTSHVEAFCGPDGRRAARRQHQPQAQTGDYRSRHTAIRCMIGWRPAGRRFRLGRISGDLGQDPGVRLWDLLVSCLCVCMCMCVCMYVCRCYV